MNPEGYNLVVLQHSIRSTLAHQTELHQLLQMMANKNPSVDILLLCETFLTTKTENLVNVSSYKLIANNRKDYKGGGVAILIKEGIPYKKRADLNSMNEKDLESLHVDITTKSGKLIGVRSLYQASNTDVKRLMDHLEMVTSMDNNNKACDLILGIYQNLDLLKSDEHHDTRNFLNLIMDNGLWPVIT